MSDEQHVHNFSGMTSHDAGHSHQFDGTTRAAYTGGAHNHNVYTTCVAQNHSHALSGYTGQNISGQNSHVHQFNGLTDSANVPEHHRHSFNVTTGGSQLIGGPGGNWTQGPGPAY